MKKLFVLGICALFIACTAPENTAETAGPDPNTDTTAIHKPNATMSNMAPTVSADNSKNAATPPGSTAKVNESTTKTTETKTVSAKSAEESGDPAAIIKKGEALYAKLDCIACHQVKIKVVGPAYADVAKKYENTPANINYLADKIINGGTGVWGVIPMIPHATLTLEDAKALAHYVLSLK